VKKYRALLFPTIGVAAALAFAIDSGAVPHSLLDRLEAIEEQFNIGSIDAHGAPDLGAMVDRIIGDLPIQDSGPEGSRAVQTLNRVIFDQLGIRASQDLKNPDNLLPSRVFESKQGYCVGIAAAYLLLAERLNLPIFAVATPSHVFLRYEDGVVRINIETLQRGANVPDEQYVREQKIPAKSIRRGVFMRNLTTDEFLAQVHNNLGVVYSERKNYEMAAAEYETALGLDPHLPAAAYNYGNDLLRLGKHRRAVRLFSRSLRLYPSDVWALNNRGLAWLKMEKPDKAKRDFQAALAIDSGFEAARNNLGSLAVGPPAK